MNIEEMLTEFEEDTEEEVIEIIILGKNSIRRHKLEKEKLRYIG